MPQSFEAVLLGKWGLLADLVQLVNETIGWGAAAVVGVVGIVLGVAWSMYGGDDVEL